MKLIIFSVFVLMFSGRVFAVGGVGDVVYDPTTDSQLATLLKQAKEQYETMKTQLDKMVSIEKTIREAQQAVDSLSKFDLSQAVKGMTPGKDATSSFSALRAQIYTTESSATNSVGGVQGNIYRIRQLENLDLLNRASITGLGEVSGNPNQATSAKSTAQSAAILAALAAQEQARRAREDADKDRCRSASLARRSNAL